MAAMRIPRPVSHEGFLPELPDPCSICIYLISIRCCGVRKHCAKCSLVGCCVEVIPLAVDLMPAGVHASSCVVVLSMEIIPVVVLCIRCQRTTSITSPIRLRHSRHSPNDHTGRHECCQNTFFHSALLHLSFPPTLNRGS